MAFHLMRFAGSDKCDPRTKHSFPVLFPYAIAAPADG
jgi:hypothetical protein